MIRKSSLRRLLGYARNYSRTLCCEKACAGGIFSFIDGEAALPINADDGSIRLIPAGTVGGESILRAVLIDSVTVIGKKKQEK